MGDAPSDNRVDDANQRADKARGKGRYTPKQKRSEEAWAGRSIVMLESPAHRVLSLAALRALYRIEVELSNHGGNDNGKLPVTFQQFEEWGVRRHSIASAIRELAALGFIEVTQHGYGGAAGMHAPNLYRLTYRPSHRLSKKERNDTTNEWRKIKTPAEAEAAAATARKGANIRNVERAKIHFATPRSVQVSPLEKGGRNGLSHPTKKGVLLHPTKGGVLSRYSGHGGDSRASLSSTSNASARDGGASTTEAGGRRQLGCVK
jgi:hypothetical protein